VGTVTSVATNTATGITGGTITTSGTIAADTLLLSTRAWRQKGIDSVAALINTRISGTTNYIPKFTSSSAIGNSVIYDNGGSIGINITDASFPLEVSSNAGGSSIKIRGRATANTSTLRFYSNDNATQIAKFEASDNAVEIGAITNVPLVFVQNASEQMRLTSTGLGIGTSSPAYKLQVNGTNGSIAISGSGYTINPVPMLIGQYTSTRGYIQVPNQGSVEIWNGGTGVIAEFNNNGNSVFYGNLGLGVTPSAWRNIFNAFQVGYTGTLYAIATSTASEQVNLASNYYQNSAGSELRIQAGYATRYQQASGQHIWSTAGTSTAGSAISFTQAMTLFSTGNLAVGGTSDNGSRLNVTGAATFSSSVTATKGYFTDYSGVGSVLSAFNYVATNATTAVIRQTGAGGNGNQDIGLIVDIQGANDLDRIANFRYYDGTNYTSRMAIMRGGNVGIGTTSPISVLNVVSTKTTALSTAADFLTLGATIDDNTDFANIGIGGGIAFRAKRNSSGTQTVYGAIDAAKETVLGDEYRGSLRFWTNQNATGVPLERMRITSGGDVGIGTTSPTGLLHLYGADPAFRIQSSTTGNMQFGQWDATNNRIQSSGRDFYLVGTDSYATIFGTNNTERMRITSTGNVGIGTTSPSERLMVSGNVRASGYFQANDGTRDFYFNPGGDFGAGALPTIQVASNHALQFATNNTLRLTIASTGAATFSSSVTATSFIASNGGDFAWGDGTTYIDGDASNQYIRAVVNNSERMRITSGGNVGIGTSSPTQLLSVNGASTFSGNLTVGNSLAVLYNTANTETALFQRSGSYGSVIKLGRASVSNTTTIDYPADGTFAVSTQGSERMRITSGGELLINTTSDAGDYKLQVNGNSYLNGITKITKSFELPHTTKSAAYTLTSDDYTVGFNVTAASITATLPDATTCAGRTYVIYQYNTGNGARGVTIDGNGAQTINGISTYSLLGWCDYSSVILQSDGSNWIILSDAIQSGCL
jgi:hypothetical protein